MKQGIYFRATDDQVDPTDYDAEVSLSANYPRTSAQGFTVGWEDTPTGTRDRTTTGDVRLRGIAFVDNASGGVGGAARYRIDLPAPGTYDIRYAVGDPSGPQACKIVLLDNASVIVSHDFGLNADTYGDAAGVIRTSVADWVANNVAVRATFSSTIFRAKMGQSISPKSANTTICLVSIESVAASGKPYSYYAQMRRQAA